MEIRTHAERKEEKMGFCHARIIHQIQLEGANESARLRGGREGGRASKQAYEKERKIASRKDKK
jgi:hypothetical protein